MSRLTVDVAELLIRLLSAPDELQDVEIRESADVDAAETLPLLTVRPVQGSMIANGAPGLGWEWSVAFTLLGTGKAAMSDLADTVYQQIHLLHDEAAGIPGIGCVSSVDDVSMFARTASAVVQAQTVHQFDALFTIRFRPLPL